MLNTTISGKLSTITTYKTKKGVDKYTVTIKNGKERLVVTLDEKHAEFINQCSKENPVNIQISINPEKATEDNL